MTNKHLNTCLLCRRELLHSALHEVEGKVYFAQKTDANSFEEIEKFLDEAVNCKR